MGDMADWILESAIEDMYFNDGPLLGDIDHPPNCPSCEKRMVLREGRYGKFWGCQDFPRCKGHLPIRR
jgi:hypothetical protein